MVQFERIRFYWRLFARILVASVNPALHSIDIEFVYVWGRIYIRPHTDST